MGGWSVRAPHCVSTSPLVFEHCVHDWLLAHELAPQRHPVQDGFTERLRLIKLAYRSNSASQSLSWRTDTDSRAKVARTYLQFSYLSDVCLTSQICHLRNIGLTHSNESGQRFTRSNGRGSKSFIGHPPSSARESSANHSTYGQTRHQQPTHQRSVS
jgi:hypothetical protein